MLPSEFAVIATQGKPKGHAVVFHKMNSGPLLVQQEEFLIILHVGFYPNLEGLIQEQDNEQDQTNFKRRLQRVCFLFLSKATEW